MQQTEDAKWGDNEDISLKYLEWLLSGSRFFVSSCINDCTDVIWEHFLMP